MQDQFSRTRMLFGASAVNALQASRVAVFGIGGVGGHAAEVLARSGLGAIDLIDNDKVSLTNINRQIYALHSTLGKYKVDVAEERIKDINPNCKVTKHCMFYLPENADSIDLSVYDYVVDCIDTVTAKIELIRRCAELGVPIICCMGAANKLDPSAFRITDINKTNTDPIAKIIRKRLRKLGISSLKCVYSEEQPLKPTGSNESEPCTDNFDVSDETIQKRNIPASNAFVPAAAGLIAGGEVVKELIRLSNCNRAIL